MTIRVVPDQEIFAPSFAKQKYGEFAGQHIYTYIDYVPYREHYDFMLGLGKSHIMSEQEMAE